MLARNTTLLISPLAQDATEEGGTVNRHSSNDKQSQERRSWRLFNLIYG